MPNPTHTPGPWLYRPEEYDDWGMVRAAPDLEGRMYVICQARNPLVGYGDLDKYRESRTDPYEANARLIAAAPELLEALEKATTLLTKAVGDIVAYRLMAGKRLSRSDTAEYVEGINAFDTLVAAITKATGHG